MSNYLYIIGRGDHIVHQLNADSGAAVRILGSYNASWSPYNGSNFDSGTGLPTSAALGGSDLQNPCALAADDVSLFILDPMTCRVIRFQPDTGTVVATFGGRRGIGSGRITIDDTPRSSISLANGSIWVSDNTGSFMVKFQKSGTFQAEYSISGWSATATGLGIPAFDQVTGFAYDTDRQTYWALCQGSANAILLEVATNATLTGRHINLTTRMVSTVGATISGHGGTPTGRLQTRGLHYRNGYLIFWSGTRVFRVDLVSTTGDRILTVAAGPVAPGWVNPTNTQIGTTVQGLPNGEAPADLVTFSNQYYSESVIERGYSVSPASGTVGQVNEPWDMTVSPYVEETSLRTGRDIWARARIRKLTAATIQAKAAIEARVTKTIQALGRILRGVQKTISAKAAIEEPTTVADALVSSWSLEDSLGAYSQQLTLKAHARGIYQVGDELTLYAGYDNRRVKLCEMAIDEITVDVDANSSLATFICRDTGCHEIDSGFATRTFALSPPDSRITAHEIVGTIAGDAGVNIGSLEFPDYDIFGMYCVTQRTALDVINDLMEPWNQFENVQHFVNVRGGRVSVERIPFSQVPSTGTTLTRRYLNSINRSQQKYLASPRLVGFDEFIVTGATFTISVAQLNDQGPQTRIEYFRNETEGDTRKEQHGDMSQMIVTETVSEETTCGDKILLRVESVYSNSFASGTSGEITGGSGTRLISRSTENYVYFEPAGTHPGPTSEDAGQCPSSRALILNTRTVREALDSGDNNTFKERFRGETNYYYDSSGQLAVETTVSREYDSDDKKWKLTELSQRTHSQTTGGSVRTQRLGFTLDDGNPILDSADGQQVSGTRPNLENANSRYSVHTFQNRAPEVTFSFVPGPMGISILVPDSPGGGRSIWTYDNPHLSQDDCETIRGLALGERGYQAGTWRWETATFEAQLTPDLKAGQPITLEVEEGEFVDYWLMSVSHRYDANTAITSGEAKRLTEDDL